MPFIFLYIPFRCYEDSLANKTIDEIRTIYANYPHPNCTPLQDTHDSQTDVEFRGLIDNFGLLSLLKYDTLDADNAADAEPVEFQSLRTNKTSAECQRWIYNLDYGYTSMTSEVGVKCGRRLPKLA